MVRKMAQEPIRIQKYMSDCGMLSRRAAEEEIRAGHIRINGEIAEIGQKVLPGTDEVLWKGKAVRPVVRKNSCICIMLNKPVGYVTTMSDERGRKCVAELVQDVGVRVYPCGRLDMNSEGLLLMTNDGALANRLTHPAHEIPKIYHVKIDTPVTPEELKALGEPMEIEGYVIRPVKVTVVTRTEQSSTLRMELYEGRNRQIRRMCEQVGLHILSLKRVAIGTLTLGDLRPGKWKRLTSKQIQYLKGN